MRGSIGLVIGLVVGAGGMYLGLHRPWERHVATVASDNPPVVVVPGDAGAGKPHKKHHRPARPAGSSAAPFDGDAEDVDTGPTTVALTAADRALDTRGDDTTLPAQTIDMAGGHDARPLEDGEISDVLGAQGGGIKDCVVAGATNTDLRGTITLKLVVDGHGKIIKTRVQAPHYLLEHGLLGCMQRALARVHFPSTGAPTLVTFPINLG